MRAANWLLEQAQIQTIRRFAWAPVCFGVGIVIYFAIKVEPAIPVLALCGALGALGLAMANWMRGYSGIVLCLLAFGAIGLAWGGLRAHRMAEPVLWKRYYGPVQGTVYAIDQSASGNMRLWLKDVQLANLQRGAPPARVRVSLAEPPAIKPNPGEVILVTAHLSPPPAPAEPGGFDFQRHAWFLRLGGVGYARAPPVVWDRPAQDSLATAIVKFRHNVANGLVAHMPERSAGVAVAITVGLRHHLDETVADSLRRANLAHLLAISGLHMGLLTTLVFVVVRLCLASLPMLALSGWVKPSAALCALMAGAAYLFVSGQSIATERAFVMAAVAFGAVIVGRRAVTLRGLALAAWIVLVLRPEAVFSPGFQMSFSATLALIVGFSALQKTSLQNWPKPLKWLTYSAISALFAGSATAPFAAAHFNLLPHYGVLANMLAIPMMGMVVMPGFLIAILGWPIGLEGVGLWIVDLGLGWTLFVAKWVSGLSGAVTLIKTPPPGLLAVFGIGLIVFLLAVRWGRLLGLGGMALCSLVWAASERPDILISDSTKLVGTMGPQGRHMSHPSRQGFVARSWLENDGDRGFQELAHDRPIAKTFAVSVKKRPETPPACEGPYQLVSDWDKEKRCDVLNLRILARTGSWAGWIREDGSVKWTTAREISGRRLWNDSWVRRRFGQ